MSWRCEPGGGEAARDHAVIQVCTGMVAGWVQRRRGSRLSVAVEADLHRCVTEGQTWGEGGDKGTQAC